MAVNPAHGVVSPRNLHRIFAQHRPSLARLTAAVLEPLAPQATGAHTHVRPMDQAFL